MAINYVAELLTEFCRIYIPSLCFSITRSISRKLASDTYYRSPSCSCSSPTSLSLMFCDCYCVKIVWFYRLIISSFRRRPVDGSEIFYRSSLWALSSSSYVSLSMWALPCSVRKCSILPKIDISLFVIYWFYSLALKRATLISPSHVSCTRFIFYVTYVSLCFVFFTYWSVLRVLSLSSATELI